MNRLFVTGDMHCNACGEFSKLNTKNFPVQKELSKDDYILIAGDYTVKNIMPKPFILH